MVTRALQQQEHVLAQLATAPRDWPAIALVTPVFNSAPYLEQTIRSVLEQQYPKLEYIIVDGGSTDGSLDIIRRNSSRVHWWVSEPDRGMYDALNKGFAQSTAEIMGWISATDLLHPGSLRVVGSVFRDLPQVDWITGIPTSFDEQGATAHVSHLRRWARTRFLAGANRYIQQESTFWRRSLWERAGGRLDDSRRMASDFDLWVRFFRHDRLFPVEALIGGFCMHGDSLGLRELEECHRIQREILEREVAALPGNHVLKLFRSVSEGILRIPVLSRLWRQSVIQALLRLPGPDLPSVIRFRESRWVID